MHMPVIPWHAQSYSMLLVKTRNLVEYSMNILNSKM